MKSFTVTPFWDKRVMNPTTKESRIMLTVNLNQSQFRLSLKLQSTKADFERALSVRGGSETVKRLRDAIMEYVSKAESILQRLPNPSKDAFVRLFKSSNNVVVGEKTDAYAIMLEQIEVCKNENRFSTSINIKNARNSLMAYKDKLYFEDLTDKWLNGYKTHMINTGRSATTAGIHLRTLRGIYKQVVKDGIVVMTKNPFEGVNVSWTAASKNVLYPEQLLKLWEYKPELLQEQRAKDFFFFCYLCNGLNFWDVANLRRKNVKGDFLTFYRSKTKTTSAVQREITVYLDDEAKRIIDVYGSKSPKPDAFLFEIFDNCKDAKHHFDTFSRHKGRNNKFLKDIAKKLKLDARVYLGVARHSFATKQYMDGNANFLSELLGHANRTTTDRYIKTLPKQNLKQLSASLLKFK